ncbi:hypothetical protein ACFQU2_12125 [Siccirubricoccus deserti]
MEADRFADPLLPAEMLEPERAVVLEERRLRTDSNPRARFWEAFEAALWGRSTGAAGRSSAGRTKSAPSPATT